MILVDTSVWIDLLGKTRRFHLNTESLFRIATCSPIIQEILQGIKNDLVHRKIKDSILALPRIEDPINLSTYLEASEIFRTAQRKGLTIRSSIDCLIATIAIRHHLPIWHFDRDFEAIAKITSLQTIQEREI